MTRYCNRESRENREERALSASGAPCLYIYIYQCIQNIYVLYSVLGRVPLTSLLGSLYYIVHIQYQYTRLGKGTVVAPLLRILVLGEFGQRKCREEGERKKRMGPRGHLKTTLKRGEGEFGGEGEGGKPHPRSFTLSPSFFRWLFLLNYTPKQRSWKLDRHFLSLSL